TSAWEGRSSAWGGRSPCRSGPRPPGRWAQRAQARMVYGPLLSKCAPQKSRRWSRTPTQTPGVTPMSVRTPMTLATIEAEQGLRAALALAPEEVVATIKESGMKGRGGAGFPTGVKWGLAAEAPAPD